MWIKNAWYIAAWSQDVGAGELFARTILGEPVLFYRQQDGAVTAMDDRCCHRLAPLSKGRLEGDDVRCMYHGVKFGPDGICTEIPGEPRIPKKYRVRSYPVVEKQNQIWIWPGDPELADPADIVDWPYLDDPAWSYKGGYLHYKSNYQLIVDNFLDFSHLPYIHENSIGTGSYDQMRPRLTPTDFGMRVENTTDDIPPAPSFAKFFDFGGNVDRWSIYNFHVRGNTLLGDFGSAPAGRGGHEGDREGAALFRHFSSLTPETETTTHYLFAQPRNFAPGDDAVDDKMLADVIRTFHEDKVMIEAQQELIELDPAMSMLPLEVDKALIHIRREVDKLIAAETPTAIAAE